MKVHEVCSCGASFDAEGRGAFTALADWRSSHYHVAAIPFVPSYPINPYPSYPWSPTVTWTTRDTQRFSDYTPPFVGNGYVAPQTTCLIGGAE